MSTERVKANGGALAPAMLTAEAVEKVLVQGNLAGLNASERLAYYKSVCESVGLNPLTRPFDYITLNGKLTLYAKRECTDQLRAVHNISIKIPRRETAEGCYIVTALATMPNGRTDESTGAVNVEGLKGEARANAVMKAETKAKRRATLSICGLSVMDETEVEGAVAQAVQAASSNPMDAPAPVPQSLAAPKQQDDAEANIKARLAQFAAMKAKIGAQSYYRILGNAGVEHANEIKSLNTARSVYREMLQAANDMQQMGVSEADIINQGQPGEGA